VDGAGDFRLISRQVVDAILAMPEYNRFSKAMFAWVGFDVAYLEYQNVSRQGGATSWTFPKLVNYAMDGLLSFNNRPLRAGDLPRPDDVRARHRLPAVDHRDEHLPRRGHTRIRHAAHRRGRARRSQHGRRPGA